MRTQYPPEFRQQMLELVRAGRSPKVLAREFEPSEQTIRNWSSRPTWMVADGPMG
jgi:transposase